MGEAFSLSGSTEANFTGAVSAQVDPTPSSFCFVNFVRLLRWEREIEQSHLPQSQHNLYHLHNHVVPLRWLLCLLVSLHGARNLLMKMMLLLPKLLPPLLLSLLQTLSNMPSRSPLMKSSPGGCTLLRRDFYLLSSTSSVLDLKVCRQNGAIRISNLESLFKYASSSSSSLSLSTPLLMFS
jgi:hypothetical protein